MSSSPPKQVAVAERGDAAKREAALSSPSNRRCDATTHGAGKNAVGARADDQQKMAAVTHAPQNRPDETFAHYCSADKTARRKPAERSRSVPDHLPPPSNLVGECHGRPDTSESRVRGKEKKARTSTNNYESSADGEEEANWQHDFHSDSDAEAEGEKPNQRVELFAKLTLSLSRNELKIIIERLLRDNPSTCLRRCWPSSKHDATAPLYGKQKRINGAQVACYLDQIDDDLLVKLLQCIQEWNGDYKKAKVDGKSIICFVSESENCLYYRTETGSITALSLCAHDNCLRAPNEDKRQFCSTHTEYYHTSTPSRPPFHIDFAKKLIQFTLPQHKKELLSIIKESSPAGTTRFGSENYPWVSLDQVPQNLLLELIETKFGAYKAEWEARQVAELFGIQLLTCSLSAEEENAIEHVRLVSKSCNKLVNRHLSTLTDANRFKTRCYELCADRDCENTAVNQSIHCHSHSTDSEKSNHRNNQKSKEEEGHKIRYDESFSLKIQNEHIPNPKAREHVGALTDKKNYCDLTAKNALHAMELITNKATLGRVHSAIRESAGVSGDAEINAPLISSAILAEVPPHKIVPVNAANTYDVHQLLFTAITSKDDGKYFEIIPSQSLPDGVRDRFDGNIGTHSIKISNRTEFIQNFLPKYFGHRDYHLFYQAYKTRGFGLNKNGGCIYICNESLTNLPESVLATTDESLTNLPESVLATTDVMKVMEENKYLKQLLKVEQARHTEQRIPKKQDTKSSELKRKNEKSAILEAEVDKYRVDLDSKSSELESKNERIAILEAEIASLREDLDKSSVAVVDAQSTPNGSGSESAQPLSSSVNSMSSSRSINPISNEITNSFGFSNLSANNNSVDYPRDNRENSGGRVQVQRCRYYFGGGGCRYGTDCKFSHESMSSIGGGPPLGGSGPSFGRGGGGPPFAFDRVRGGGGDDEHRFAFDRDEPPFVRGGPLPLAMAMNRGGQGNTSYHGKVVALFESRNSYGYIKVDGREDRRENNIRFFVKDVMFQRNQFLHMLREARVTFSIGRNNGGKEKAVRVKII